MPDFIAIVAIIALIMLIWDCVEVGRNDAANLVNAVFGSRVMTRQHAVILAGIAVVLGATFASPVMETARKGIFDPTALVLIGGLQAAVIVYITAYIVDTALLYTYSAFGMPVSTTASLIFELVGASVAVAWSLGIVHWDKVGTVLSAIILSIILSGIAGWLVQRMFRGAIQDDPEDHLRNLIHGPWIAGLMLTWLSWFMLMKGLKAVPFVKAFKENTLEAYGPAIFLLTLWGGFTLLIHLWLTATGKRGTRNLFRFTAVIGMICLSFAFGQNDLANCASPGLSAIWIYFEGAISEKNNIPQWALFICGVLMVIGMSSRSAQRVTRAAVNTGSQYDHVALYAPKWCRRIAKWFIKKEEAVHPEHIDLAPAAARDKQGKRIHFDPLRASVIMSVSASVIAFASSRGIPVSTTYVTFAAVVATGWADGVMTRGDGDRKIGRAIWVVFSWFAGALIAMLAAGLVALIIFKLKVIGLVIGIGANLLLRVFVSKRSDLHEKTHHEEIAEQLRVDEGLPLENEIDPAP